MANAVVTLAGKDPDLKGAMAGLTRAYKVRKDSAMVLNHLANHFFYRNDLNKALVLAQVTDRGGCCGC